MNTNTKTISTPFAIILTAILLVVSCVASLIAVSIFGNSSAKNTQDTLANAQNVLTEYNTSYSGMYFEFTNDIYLKADYIGYSVPDEFVVGYGLDYDGYGRNYRDIYTVVE